MRKTITMLVMAVVCIMAGCSKDDNTPKYKINEEVLVTNFDKDFQFLIEGDPLDVTWSSSDEWVGTIDEEGLFVASKIGNTTIIATIGGATVKSEVTVESYNEMFIEPYADYGSSKEAIKAKESRQIAGEDAEAILYVGENTDLSNVMYLFTNDKMDGAAAVFGSDDSKMEQVLRFYLERYEFLGTSDNVGIFDNGISNLLVGLTAELGWVALYSKSEMSTSQPQSLVKKEFDFNALKKSLNGAKETTLNDLRVLDINKALR